MQTLMERVESGRIRCLPAPASGPTSDEAGGDAAQTVAVDGVTMTLAEVAFLAFSQPTRSAESSLGWASFKGSHQSWNR